MQFKQWISYLGIGVLTTSFAISSQAAIWSSTEIHYSSGDYLNFTNDKHDDTKNIITFQHSSGHKYGINFFFVDHLRSDTSSEFYGEWYSTFSLGAITGSDMSFGAVKDVGLIAGFNFAPGSNSMYTLPGVSLALDLPGFAFANLDITGYNHIKTDGSSGEESSYMLDFNWAYPFKVGGLSWSVEGHAEYIAGRDLKDGTAKLEDWILMQPQVRLDLGEALGNEAGNLFVGIEYQYWKNKYGVKDKNESVVQLQTVWNF
jgi:nucleoside-specific outer membrane channel protein Tsx